MLGKALGLIDAGERTGRAQGKAEAVETFKEVATGRKQVRSYREPPGERHWDDR